MNVTYNNTYLIVTEKYDVLAMKRFVKLKALTILLLKTYSPLPILKVLVE